MDEGPAAQGQKKARNALQRQGLVSLISHGFPLETLLKIEFPGREPRVAMDLDCASPRPDCGAASFQSPCELHRHIGVRHHFPRIPKQSGRVTLPAESAACRDPLPDRMHLSNNCRAEANVT